VCGKKRVGIFVMAAVGAAILLGQSNSWAAPPITACALLTEAEVQTALGVAVGAAKGPLPKICQWREQAKPGTAILILDVNGPDLKLFNSVKATSQFTGARITHVGGLGDEAFFFYKAIGRNVSEVLWVRKGDFAFNVRIWGKKIPDADREAKEKSVAQTVLAKI
jgi:hypothetical protein